MIGSLLILTMLNIECFPVILIIVTIYLSNAKLTYYHNQQVGNLTVVSYLNHFCPGKFEHDLFDCCGDLGSCCFSWCCPCIVASQIATKIGQSECCYCLGVWCFGGCAVACLRGDFRKYRNINGGCIADCITSIWCTPCALTQMHKETQNM